MKHTTFLFLLLACLTAKSNPTNDYIIEFSIEQAESILSVDASLQTTEYGTYQLRADVTGGIPGYEYLWLPENGLSNNRISNPMLLSSNVGNYTLTVTDAKGCYASISIETSTNINETKLTDNIDLFVNDNLNLIFISFSELNPIKANVVLYDLNGNKIFKQVFEQPAQEIQISTHHLKNGIYIVSVITTENRKIEKIIVK